MAALLSSAPLLQSCPVCGGNGFEQRAVLWESLVHAWGLSAEETAFINRQQGFVCIACGSNLRSMTLAAALCELFDWSGTLAALATSPPPATYRVLEINPAGSLSPWLQRFPGHRQASYPELDMQQMPFPADSFDLVLHSDTLEHVPDPVTGLQECLRIVKPGGRMLMTIPVLPTRLTRRRDGLPPSFHGAPGPEAEDMRVVTEYGADFYRDLFAAGWRKLFLFSAGGLESFVIVGCKDRTASQGESSSKGTVA